MQLFKCVVIRFFGAFDRVQISIGITTFYAFFVASPNTARYSFCIYALDFICSFFAFFFWNLAYSLQCNNCISILGRRSLVRTASFSRMSRKEKYDNSSTRRQQTFMSPEDAASGKKSNWHGIEITGGFFYGFVVFFLYTGLEERTFVSKRNFVKLFRFLFEGAELNS